VGKVEIPVAPLNVFVYPAAMGVGENSVGVGEDSVEKLLFCVGCSLRTLPPQTPLSQLQWLTRQRLVNNRLSDPRKTELIEFFYSIGPVMTLDEAAHLGAVINKMLAAHAIPPRFKIAILGGALACALLELPRRARKAALEAHAAALAETIGECGERYNSEC